jgi:hypothetical protein
MIKTLKRVEPIQLGKVLGVLYGLMSLIFVPFFLMFSFIISAMPKASGAPNAAFPASVGMVMAILMPFMYALMGFITGVIGAVLYNVVAKWMGGIQVEVE